MKGGGENKEVVRRKKKGKGGNEGKTSYSLEIKLI